MVHFLDLHFESRVYVGNLGYDLRAEQAVEVAACLGLDRVVLDPDCLRDADWIGGGEGTVLVRFGVDLFGTW